MDVPILRLIFQFIAAPHDLFFYQLTKDFFFSLYVELSVALYCSSAPKRIVNANLIYGTERIAICNLK